MLSIAAAIVLALALGGWVAYNAARALQTGTARASRGATFVHAKQPAWYWITVVGQIVIALGCLGFIVWLLSEFGRRGA